MGGCRATNARTLVRCILKDLVAEHDIQLTHALAPPGTEARWFVEIRVSRPHYDMPSESWMRQRDRMARVRAALDRAGLRHAQHCGVILVRTNQPHGEDEVKSQEAE